ncbi:MAG: aldo/keto reductase [Pirellulaceae bacterium]
MSTITLPLRVLGRTKEKVSSLALGTWPCGRSSEVSVNGVVELVHVALELGITFIDTANAYGKAEEAVGIALGTQRDKVFLATKVWADTAQEAEKSLADSLQKLQTDHLDLVYVHSIGDRDVPRVMAVDGSLDFLVRQKEQGRIRFVGISGHSRPEQFVPLIKTGKVDVVMLAMNFVDVHTYGFEHKVLPAAQEFGLGVACMKVFGGMKGSFEAADGPNMGPMIPQRAKELAVRYALGLDPVATLVIGPHTVEQLRENARLVRDYQPLTDQERVTLLALGKNLAPAWGPHFGSVV